MQEWQIVFAFEGSPRLVAFLNYFLITNHFLILGKLTFSKATGFCYISPGFGQLKMFGFDFHLSARHDDFWRKSATPEAYLL